MPSGKSRRGARLIPLSLPKLGTTKIYAGARVGDALEELEGELNLYHGVRMTQVMEAVYEQGRRDGRSEVFDRMDGLAKDPELKHRNPGRPKKK